jgi:hypothetical protein
VGRTIVVVGPVKGIQNGLKMIQNILNDFKTIQNLFNSKRIFPISKNLKSNMVAKDLKKETTFSIGISSDSK